MYLAKDRTGYMRWGNGLQTGQDASVNFAPGSFHMATGKRSISCCHACLHGWSRFASACNLMYRCNRNFERRQPYGGA